MQNVNVIDSNIPAKSKPTKSVIFGWVRYVLVLILLFCVLHYGFGIKIVDGHSMNPTLSDKGIMLMTRLYFKPERGDIVVVKDPHGFDIVKRIIGLPSDKILIKNGIVHVNGTPLKETYTKGKANDLDEVVVNNHSYFIMGDNRTPGESLDSRDQSMGPIDKSRIEGKIIFH